VLVVKALNKDADRGKQHLLRSKLDQMPTGLNNLFREMLQKDHDEDDNDRLLPAVMWVEATTGSLTAIELYYAIMSSVGQLDKDNLIPDCDMIDQKSIMDYLVSSSRGFLELPEGSKRIQFIHESVREYFLDFGLRSLDTSLSEDTKANCIERVAGWLQDYLNLTVRCGLFGDTEQHLSLRQCPLLSYATKFTLKHAEKAAALGCARALYKEVPFTTWQFVTEETLYAPSTMLQKLIMEDLPWLVNIELDQIARCPIKETQRVLAATTTSIDCSTALHLAIIGGNVRIIRALLDSGAEVNAHLHQCETSVDIDGDTLPGYMTPLTLAVHRALKNVSEIVATLLEYGANVNPKSNRELLLHTAAARGETEIVKLLLQYGAKVYTEDSSSQTAMEAAEFWGHTACVSIIREHIAASGAYQKSSIRERLKPRRLLTRFTRKA
jgi:hypothetical protein